MKFEQTPEEAEKLFDTLIEFVINYGLDILGGITFLIIGLWLVKRLTKVTKRIMEKKGTNPTLSGFILSLINIALKVLVIISVMGMIGIQMASFIAILGAAGLAVGLALQGTLQNFAGGVLILALKPYKIGDYISTQGHDGIVKDIQIFNTILTTVDNKTIILPNSGISNSSLVNFSEQKTRRVDWSFGVAYGSNIKEIKSIIQSVLDNEERILKDPKTFIGMSEMADSSINFTTRAWVNASDYWGVYFDTNETIYTIFNEKGVEIPFPQMDVHLNK